MHSISHLWNRQLQIGKEFEVSNSAQLIPKRFLPCHQPVVHGVDYGNNQGENANHDVQNDIEVGGERELFGQVCVS